LAYLVLARKYRPATLAELIGQEHIARALGNAIAMNRVPHALLFCGARGTGKTSTARIVAKMLNCVTGPTSTPCGICSPCKEITAGNCIDVLELDAASNRGIDEIRDLRSGVGYSPVRDRSKVYIVDEAHMLTDQAANAFLKTLEEPPAHVTFILATTDPQRLPVTIRSRCQRYDFRRVKAGDVVKALDRICQQEGIQADPAALYLVAREGDGSMRDSLSVLDQVIAFGGAHMDDQTVASLLGVADRSRTHQLMKALLEHEAGTALQAVAAAHDHGMDLRTFARSMAMEARDLLVTRLAGGAARDLVDRAESEIESLAKLAELANVSELERIAHVLLELAEQVGRARHPRLVLEMGMVRLCRAAALIDVAELAVRVEGLLASGARSFGGPPRPGNQGPQGGGSQGGSGGPQGLPRPSGAGGPPPFPQPPPKNQASPSVAEVRPVQALRTGANPVGPPTPTAPAMPVPQERNRLITDQDVEAWQNAVRDALGKPVIASLLNDAVVQPSQAGRILLAFANDFIAGQAREAEALRWLTQGAVRAFGGEWQIEIGPSDPRAREESLGARRLRAQKTQRSGAEQQLRQDPRVRSLVEALAGDIVEVVVHEEPGPRKPPPELETRA
jgi:DNA polymerase-3 subunit gamma/tau